MDDSMSELDNSIIQQLTALRHRPVDLGLNLPGGGGYHQWNDESGEGEGEEEYPPEEDDGEEEEEDEEEGDGEEGDGEGEEEEEGEEVDEDASETSSIMFDRELDPEAWGRRLDEIAGVMEMSELESRSIRWGPALGGQHPTAPLSIADFKALLNNHLNNTEWKYSSPATLLPLPNRGIEPDTSGLGLPQLHAIRVLGAGWSGRDVDSGWDDVPIAGDEDVVMTA